MTSGCETLAQKEYKRWHDNVTKKFHWDIYKRDGLEHSEKWYEHAPEGAVENEEIEVLWDINIKCNNLIEARRPDLIVIDKREQKGIIIDIAVPADVRVQEKEKEKVEKYQDLKKKDQKGHSLNPGPGHLKPRPLKQEPLIKEPINKGSLGCLVAHNVCSNSSTKDVRNGARWCKLTDRKGKDRNE